MQTFNPDQLKKLKRRVETPDNGQVTIIGGSDLFHGAPILSLKVASRIVDMVYFSSPEPSTGKVAENLKSQLSSFIWVPWEEIGDYIKKSDSVLIGPGMKRWHKEKEKDKYQDKKVEVFDQSGTQTKFATEKFLKQFPNKQWVIDGGALQVMDPKLIPEGAIITPNTKEFELLFGKKSPSEVAKEHKCTVVFKTPKTVVCSTDECAEIQGGNNGLTKGGTGDVLAGLTVALSAKNNPFLAAAAGAWIVKKAADDLLERVGTVYNADDLAFEVPKVLGKYLR
ncbi:hypothetical protein CMO96_00680 [Candidatus Woesebacteria bacterium]|nr:hypothetical protein [Candidatus Woesebacteria bacterium]